MKVDLKFKEHRKMNIKKIIAREGLIILGILLPGIILLLIGNILITQPTQIQIDVTKLPDQPTIYTKIGYNLNKIGLLLLLFAYPLHWLIRFVIWAIKTLRQKEA
jgi:hypothetical protein